MKRIALALTAAAFGCQVYAQHPPTDGDVAPAPLPMEGKKKLEPSPTRGRVAPSSHKAMPRIPVKPPTPKPTEPDPVQ